MTTIHLLDLYDAFKTAGFSHKQALALTAEVGRENDYREDLIFGHHQDSGRWNAGMMSWNQARGAAFMDYMKVKGMVQSGDIVRSQESLNTEAEFVMKEIRTSYPRTKEAFLDKPDVNRREAARILGSDYIRWDMAGNHIGKAGALSASRKRDKYYDEIAARVEARDNEV